MQHQQLCIKSLLQSEWTMNHVHKLILPLKEIRAINDCQQLPRLLTTFEDSQIQLRKRSKNKSMRIKWLRREWKWSLSIYQTVLPTIIQQLLSLMPTQALEAAREHPKQDKANNKTVLLIAATFWVKVALVATISTIIPIVLTTEMFKLTSSIRKIKDTQFDHINRVQFLRWTRKLSRAHSQLNNNKTNTWKITV